MIKDEKYVKVVVNPLEPVKQAQTAGLNTDILITQNGTYTPQLPYTGFNLVEVQVTGSANVTSLNVTPTKTSQTIRATGGIDGFTPVNVAAVTSSIDSNIQAGNIKSGVSILGVTGNLVALNGQEKTVRLNGTVGTFEPDSGKNAITSIIVVASLMSNYGENEYRIIPTTSEQSIPIPSGYAGFDNLSVAAVNSSIDSNISAGNIKQGITILGVQGSCVPAPAYYTQKKVSSGELKSYADVCIDFTGITKIGNGALAFAYNGNQDFDNFEEINFDNITEIKSYGCYYAFNWCGRIRDVSFGGSYKTIRSYGCYCMFYNTAVTGVLDLSGIQTVEDDGCTDMFSSCSNITGVNLYYLQTVGTWGCYGMFSGCSNLTGSIYFHSLSNINGMYALGSMFSSTKIKHLYFEALTSSSFGSYTDQFSNMLYNVNGCIVHFPSNLQSVIGSWSSVISGFGGTNTTVLFDLTATS